MALQAFAPILRHTIVVKGEPSTVTEIQFGFFVLCDLLNLYKF